MVRRLYLVYGSPSRSSLKWYCSLVDIYINYVILMLLCSFSNVEIFDFESVSDDDQDPGFNFEYEAPEELYSFSTVDDGLPVEAQTVNGRRLPNIGFPPIENTMKVPLGNPLYCKRLQSWYLGRLAANIKQNVDETDAGFGADRSTLVYQNIAFNSELESDSSDSSNSDSDGDEDVTARPRSPRAESVFSNSSVQPMSVSNTSLPSLVFDSEFESGNCDKIYRVYGRPNPPICVNNGTIIHQEYDVHVRKDIYTTGSSQWYFFSADSSTITARHMAEVGQSALTPLTVRFNVVNMLKKDSLYNYGMAAAVYSAKQAAVAAPKAVGWHHAGDFICYYKNGRFVSKKKKNSRRRSLYTATFTYTFQHPEDKVFFAYCFPYTYTRLQEFITRLEQDKGVQAVMRRQKLCETLAGNRCDMLTVSEPVSGGPEAVLVVRPAIVVSARVHPGETNSSFAMQGFLQYITSSNPDALLLRKMFVFKIIPMLNPDGVIHGNNRCNLAGTDLNRRYLEAHEFFHPTIRALKDLLMNLQDTRGVLMFVDLHGHSKKKNSFVYGCDFSLQSDRYMAALPRYTRADHDARRIYPKIFPRLLCTLSNAHGHSSGHTEEHQLEHGYFSWKDCCFKVQKTKAGCGRIVVWRQCLVEAAYTIELSFCSNGNNAESKLVRQFFSVSGQSSSGNNNGTSKLTPDLQKLVNEINAINDSKLSVISRADASERGRSDSRLSGRGSSAGNRSGAGSPRGQDLGETTDPSSPEYVVHQMHKLFHSHYAYKSRADIHQASYHYSEVDFMKIGEHIGLAMAKFCNLTEANVTKEMNRLRFLASLQLQSKAEAQFAPASVASSRRNSINSTTPADCSLAAGEEEQPSDQAVPSRRAGHKVFEQSTSTLFQSVSPTNEPKMRKDKSSKLLSPAAADRSPRVDLSSEDAGVGDEQGDGGDKPDQTAKPPNPKGRKVRKGKRKSVSVAAAAGTDALSGTTAGGDTSGPKKRGKRKSKYSTSSSSTATSIIDLVSANMLDVPLTKPTVFGVDTLYAEFDRLNRPAHSSTPLPLRLQTELRLRQTLPAAPLDEASEKDKNNLKEKLKQLIGEASESEPDDAGSAGSDSEPSVDNLPLFDIVQKNKKKMKSTGRPNIFARYKVTKQWVKKEQKSIDSVGKKGGPSDETVKSEERPARKDIRDGIPTPVMYGMTRSSMLNKGPQAQANSRCPPLAKQESSKDVGRERSSSGAGSVQLPAAVLSPDKAASVPMRHMHLDLSSEFGAMTMMSNSNSNSSNSLEAAQALAVASGSSSNPLSTSSSRGNGLLRQQSTGKMSWGRPSPNLEGERESFQGRPGPLERTVAADRCNERPNSSGSSMSPAAQSRGLGTCSPPRTIGGRAQISANMRHVTANNSPNNIANRHRLGRGGSTVGSMMLTMGAGRGGSTVGSMMLTMGAGHQGQRAGAVSATTNSLQFLAQKAQQQAELERRAMQPQTQGKPQLQLQTQPQERVDRTVVTSPINRHRKVSVSSGTKEGPTSPSPGGFSSVFASKLVGGASRNPTPDPEAMAVTLPSTAAPSGAGVPPARALSTSPASGVGCSRGRWRC